GLRNTGAGKLQPAGVAAMAATRLAPAANYRQYHGPPSLAAQIPPPYIPPEPVPSGFPCHGPTSVFPWGPSALKTLPCGCVRQGMELRFGGGLEGPAAVCRKGEKTWLK